RGAGVGARGLLRRGRRPGPVPVAAPVGRHPAAPVGPAARGHLLRRAVSGAQRRGAARCDQQQGVSSEAGQHHRAPQGHHDPAARNRVYGAGVRLRAAGKPAARQAGGNAMKCIAAFVPLLLVLTPGASPGVTGGPVARDGEGKAVSVLTAAGSVEVAVERREGQVRVKIGSERTAFEAWSSRDVTPAGPLGSPDLRPGSATNPGREPGVQTGKAARGGQAARVATPAQSGDGLTIDAYLAAHAKESAQSQAARITVTWDNADLREVVAGFAAFSGRTIIVSKDVKGQVSAEIKNQPWDLAFNAVLESQGLAANVLDGGIIQVIDKRDLARADSTVPVETRLVRVNYAKASALVPSVASILTKRGAVVADSTSNALVITEI